MLIRRFLKGLADTDTHEFKRNRNDGGMTLAHSVAIRGTYVASSRSLNDLVLARSQPYTHPILSRM